MALGAAEAGWRRPDTLAAPVKPARAVHRRREPRKTGLSKQEERAGKGQGSRDGPGRQPLQGSYGKDKKARVQYRRNSGRKMAAEAPATQT